MELFARLGDPPVGERPDGTFRLHAQSLKKAGEAC